LSLESLPPSAQPNHFNLIRLVAASAVIVSHSFGLAANRPDPLQVLTGFDLGTTAVLAFFAISGFFISLSFDRRSSAAAFIVARVTRIVPALLVCSLVTAFIVGPLFTASDRYFRETSVWLYPAQVTSIVRIMAAHLPAMFVHNPHPGEVDTSLCGLTGTAS
jgi:peptidoglycan/LPS O-acetylase OafA/YrhL